MFTNRSLPSLVSLLENGERATRMLGNLNDKTEELEYRSRETNQHMKHLSKDYLNLISK